LSQARCLTLSQVFMAIYVSLRMNADCSRRVDQTGIDCFPKRRTWMASLPASACSLWTRYFMSLKSSHLETRDDSSRAFASQAMDTIYTYLTPRNVWLYVCAAELILFVATSSIAILSALCYDHLNRVATKDGFAASQGPSLQL
jgi:hypothetical protein